MRTLALYAPAIVLGIFAVLSAAGVSDPWVGFAVLAVAVFVHILALASREQGK